MSGKGIPTHFTQQESIEVGILEWEKGEGTTVLETSGLGPCIGVVTYDQARNIGHIAHIPNPDWHSDTVNEFLRSVAGGNDDPSKLKVWVRGGAADPLSDEESVAHTKKSRKYIVDKIRELGVIEHNLDFEWAVSSDSVSIELDCETGDIVIDVTGQYED